MEPLRVERLSGGQKGYIVDFRTMAHPDYHLSTLVVAIVVWDTGGITTEDLSNLLSIERVGKEE